MKTGDQMVLVHSRLDLGVFKLLILIKQDPHKFRGCHFAIFLVLIDIFPESQLIGIHSQKAHQSLNSEK